MSVSDNCLLTAARALGGEVRSGEVLCPGPGHSSKDRSLAVRFDAAAAEGFIVKSFADDDFAECREHVRRRLGLEPWRPRASRRVTRPSVVKETSGDEGLAARIAVAVRIWCEGVHARDTLVERYLESRALRLDDDLAPTLRFHARLPIDGAPAPAMIALLRDVNTDAPCGIHRTWLDQNGRKLARRMLGRAQLAAIKLNADGDVTNALTIGEGVETCLAARQLDCGPVWALGSAGAINAFPVLAGIETLRILGEHDQSGANARAVEQVAERWLAAGREVLVFEPAYGDMNDALIGRVT